MANFQRAMDAAVECEQFTIEKIESLRTVVGTADNWPGAALAAWLFCETIATKDYSIHLLNRDLYHLADLLRWEIATGDWQAAYPAEDREQFQQLREQLSLWVKLYNERQLELPPTP